MTAPTNSMNKKLTQEFNKWLKISNPNTSINCAVCNKKIDPKFIVRCDYKKGMSFCSHFCVNKFMTTHLNTIITVWVEDKYDCSY